MKAFGRALNYVWPQWHRLVTIFCSVLLIALLFSFSIATVLPLLKVMMGEEGLHGWVNRTISQDRYGLKFYVPDSIDLADPQTAYHLRIVEVEEDELAELAGLRVEDLIVGAGSLLVEGTTNVPSAQLVRELATIENADQIVVQYTRLDETRQLTRRQALLAVGGKPFYADYAQWLVSFVDVEQTKESKKEAVIYIILLMALVTAVRCVARFYHDYTVHKVVNTSLARLREDAFGHSLAIPVGHFVSEGASNTVSRFVQDTAMIGAGMKVLLGKTLREPLKALGMIAAAMWIDVGMTLVFLCGAPLAMYAINRLGRRIKRATKKSLASWAKMLGKLEESLNAVRVIKVYNRQEYERRVFGGINRGLLKQQLKIGKVDSSTAPLLETLGMIAGSVGLVFGAHWVYKGTMEASEFFTLLILLGTTAESVRKVSDVWNKFQQANAASERVFAVLDRPLEPERSDGIDLPPLTGKIEFQDILFTYPGSDHPVLKGVNLSVEAGHNVAIVGPNGSGKTTLANLIPRFYNPDRGRILIDGRDIQEATLSSLRSQIAMVTQNVVTFHDTIAANIAYGKADASEEQIIDAAKRAYAHEFVALLPEGYDTIIGERGAGLSGGQLQRIVIARAIVKNPAILIFDEATSQVDADSEAKIHRAIEEIMQDRTSFIIAHRFSTVVSADVIVVMEDGRIVAQGQHEHLIRSCRLYQSLYETQLVRA